VEARPEVNAPHGRAEVAERCPLCGEANGCALAAGSAARCWCSDASFTAAVRARAASAGDAMRCICARCAASAAADDEAAAPTIARPR